MATATGRPLCVPGPPDEGGFGLSLAGPVRMPINQLEARGARGRLWFRSRPGARDREPGNRAGGAGLIVLLVGAAGYLIERPPSALDFGEQWGWTLVFGGFALCVWGVVREWRGPRRRSALLPGVAALTFAWWLGWVAAENTVLIYRSQPVEFTRDDIRYRGLLYLPRAERPRPGIAFLPGRDHQAPRALRSMARSLARAGIAALIYERSSDWQRPPRPIDDRSRQALALDAARAARFLAGQTAVAGGRVGLMGYGEQGWVLPAAAESSPSVSFVVSVSTPLPLPDSVKPAEVPTLAMYGTGDPDFDGLAAAYQASGLLTDEGHPDSRVRVFIRAGRSMQAPSRYGNWFRPRYAHGLVDFVAHWVSTRRPGLPTELAQGTSESASLVTRSP